MSNYFEYIKGLPLGFLAPEQRQQIQALFAVNQANLTADMGACAGYYDFYAQLSVDAELVAQHAELQLEIYEAQLAKHLRMLPPVTQPTTPVTPAPETEATPAEGNGANKTAKKTAAKKVAAPTPQFEKEADLKRAYALDPQWQQLSQAVISAQYNRNVMKSVARAFEMKSEMLRSISRRELVLQGQETE